MYVRYFFVFFAFLFTLPSFADSTETQSDVMIEYPVNAGDALEVFVWNEPELTREVLVRPDGYISVPLAGHVMARGRQINQIEKDISESLSRYLRDKPVVTVSVLKTSGYKIYVLGKVNRPGEYMINQPIDVMQALALAGGLNSFAAENSINVLHRNTNGSQQSQRFRYGDVKEGEELSSNMLLHSGDIVVVP